MALHFSTDELASRRDKVCAAMVSQDLDGLLLFRQESHYYLTGYETFGYCFFQCMVLGADGALTLLTRSADLRQARHTSMVEDIREWVDSGDANPALALRDVLAGLGYKGKRLGVEYDAYGLTAANGRRIDEALSGWCTLVDASKIVSLQRQVKSETELTYVRRAAALADDALDQAVASAAPGAWEGDILAAMHGAVFRGDGDYPGNEFIIGSGKDALLCRYHSGRRHLDSEDQLTLEWAGVYRRYHACLMRTLVVGQAEDVHRNMHNACHESMAACLEKVAPGHVMGDVFDAHAGVMDSSGYRDHRLNACGYSLGATFTPTWMDYPMFYHGNEAPIVPGMVLFLHMILMDSGRGKAMTLGQTVIVNESGYERLSRHALDLITV